MSITHVNDTPTCLVDAVRFLRSSLRSPAHHWEAGQREAAEEAVCNAEAHLGIESLPAPTTTEGKTTPYATADELVYGEGYSRLPPASEDPGEKGRWEQHAEGHWNHYEAQGKLDMQSAPVASAAAPARQFVCPVNTVADLVNNLLGLDQSLPIYGAQYIDHPTRGRCAITAPPTVSRERVKDLRWIGQGETLNAVVVWTRAEQPAEDAAPPRPPRTFLDENRAAIERSCQFMEQQIAPRKCDSDGVSGCWRCQSLYLARMMQRLITSQKTEQDQPPPREQHRE